MNNAKIGQFISEKRKMLGLTQQELAEKLQITNKAVSKWETGDGMPDIQLLKPLANELGTTVDEILNGEESTKEESVSSLAVRYSYDLPVGVVVTCFLAAFFALYNTVLCFNQALQFICWNVYGDALIEKLPNALISVGFGLYWVIISIIFMCKFLKIFDYSFKAEKGLTIVAFVLGFVMLFVESFDFSPINYGLFMFSFALLLGTFHGYRVPHKVFFGLSILSVCVYGITAIFTSANSGTVENSVLQISDSTQIYAFVHRFLSAIVFYVFYELLEKFSSEYEGVEE